MTRVFWSYVCVTEATWEADESSTKLDHIVRTFAGWLDNNEDGVIDDETIAIKMKQVGASYNIFADDEDR